MTELLSTAIFGDNVNVLAVSCVAFVVVSVAFVLVLLRRRRKNRDAGGEEPGESAPEEEQALAGEMPVSAGGGSGLSQEVGLPDLAAAVSCLPPGKLQSLLEARLEDIEDEDADTARVFAVAGVLDEIRILLPSSSDGERSGLPGVQTALNGYLGARGAELIDDDEWNPDRQRALEVRKDLPPGAAPEIAEKVASGVMIGGKIARKQTVVLRMGA